ncbi:DUF4882 family protein [Acinetobacter nematophilus]|uniref:DUF4882 family protein n=1 Tax=Acinetobacter nematophilus TaxID=2994642 RepID=A0A9X3DSC6_9GAMM|nr:DUF4882 family protein [Acinetobacter nematophilus]MCX5466226.1 DUF4882 family protein [Acinetobacter nematophilus]
MKRLTIAILTGLMSASGWSACNFNFDTTSAFLTFYRPGYVDFPSLVGQTTSASIEPTTSLLNVKKYLAGNAKDIAYLKKGIVLQPQGIFAFEYKFKVPATALPNNEFLTTSLNKAVMYYFTGIPLPPINYLVEYQNNAGEFTNNVGFVLNMFGGGISFPVTSTPDGYQRIGIYINQDAKQIGVIYNGVDKGYFPNGAPVKIKSITFENAMEYGGINSNSPTIGKDVSIELITDKNQFQFTYPVGTMDICGNSI